MKILFQTIFILLLTSSAYSQTNIDSPLITKSQQFEYAYSVSRIPDIENAISVYESFIQNQDTSLAISIQGDNMISYLMGELFPSYVPKNHLEFQFLNLGFLNKSTLTVTTLVRQNLSTYGDEYKDVLHILYIYKAIIKKDGDSWKINLSTRDELFSVKKSLFGSYLYNPSRTKKNSLKKKKYKQFASSLEKRFSLNRPQKKIKYIISDRNDAMKFFGFSYSLSVTSMYMKTNNILLNCLGVSIDKHELAHYYTERYKLGKFLAEGFSVYIGGSQGYTFSEFLKLEINNFKLLDASKKSEWINLYLKGKLVGGEYMPFFYALSGLLIKSYFINHDETEIINVFTETPQISPSSFIQKFLLNDFENTKDLLVELIDTQIND